MPAQRKTTPRAPRRAASTQKSEAASLLDRIRAPLFSETHVAECRAKFEHLGDDEFVLVMRKAVEINADPLKGDVYLKMRADGGYTALATLAAMRTFAQLQGDYAGDDQTMTYVSTDDPLYATKVASGISITILDPSKVDPDTNPKGIVSCSVGIYRHIKGEWRRHAHTVAWSDYVPLFGGKIAGEAWENLPFVMIQKVAEVGALRKAYPQLGAVYIEEEMQQAANRQDPGEGKFSNASPKTQKASAAPREPKPIPAKGWDLPINVNFLNDTLTEVPAEEYAERVGGFLWKLIQDKHPEKVLKWFEVNALARQEFYNWDARNGRQNAMRLKRYEEMAHEHIRKKRETPRGRRTGQRAAPQEARA